MRPDEIGMRICDDVVIEASRLQRAYGEGQVQSAYTALSNIAASTAALMNGFAVVHGIAQNPNPSFQSGAENIVEPDKE